MSSYFGSSGTLISAALESAGYFYQSWILDSLLQHMEGSIGGLLYIVGLIFAIMSVAVLGNYRFALWLLFGPGIFLQVIGSRVESRGTSWTFGNEARDEGERNNAVQQILEGAADNADVSARVNSLFAYYNRLVSKSVRSVVATMNAGREKQDGAFLVRGETYAQLTSVQLEEPHFRELIGLGLLRECREGIEAARRFSEEYEVAAPPRLGPLRDANAPNVPWSADMRQNWSIYMSKFVNHRLSLSPNARQFVANLYIDYPTIAAQLVSGSSQALTVDQGSIDTGRPVPIRSSASIDIQRLIKETIDREANGTANASFPQGEDRLRKLQAQMTLLDGRTYSCEQVWGLIYFGLHRYAHRALANALDQGAVKGLDRQRLLDDLRALAGFERNATRAISVWEPNGNANPIPGAPRGKYTWQEVEGSDQQTLALDGLYRIIARYLLRNEMDQNTISAFVQDFSNRANEFRTIQSPAQSDLAITERARNNNREWSERTRMISTASKLPYYQGLGLFILAVTFPFFCMLLILPGKHAGFLLWFLLWFWLKSWDIGFAVVMLLDDVLLSIFSKANPKAPLDPNVFGIIDSLRATDPTFHLTAYYTILAIALGAIPIISSQLIMGSLQAGAGLISAGMTMKDALVADRAIYASGQQQIDKARDSYNNRYFFRGIRYMYDTIGGSQYRNVPLPVEYDHGNNSRGPQWQGLDQESLRKRQIAAAKIEGYASFKAGPMTSTVDKLVKDGLPGSAAKGSPGLLQNSTVQGAIGWAGTNPAILANFYRERYAGVRHRELARLHGWAQWDEIRQSESKRQLMYAVANGQLPIPWTAGAGFDEELNNELYLLMQDYKAVVAYLKFVTPGSKKSEAKTRVSPETQNKAIGIGSAAGEGAGADGDGL